MPFLDPALLAHLDRPLRPWLTRLPASVAFRVYSRGRRLLLDGLVDPATAEGVEPVEPPERLGRTLWGVRFRSPLGNAAGMFKNGRGYALCARQGAGYYLAGTTTAEPRSGNRRAGVAQPFAPYPRSGAASNWLGLPNEGHAVVAERLARIERLPGCPVGASLAAVQPAGGCPNTRADETGEGDPTAGLVDGLARYADAGVDFLEVNESCPNTEAEPEPAGERAERQMEALRRRLEAVAEGFFAPRRQRPPVVVKFSVDTDPEQVGPVVDLLVELGFDGVDFGNTSTAYAAHRGRIDRRERGLYDRFTRTFGGGVSGRPLRQASLELAGRAVEHVGASSPGREFHVVRTGGIEDAGDLGQSEAAGIALDGWFTGYFEAFSRRGHRLYAELYAELGRPSEPATAAGGG